MPFSGNARNLFDDLYWQKSQPIRGKYDAALTTLDYRNETNKHPLYLQVIKEFAREDFAALVSSYIEVHKRIGSSPDEEDFEAFADELKGIIPRFKDYFASRHRGSFSPLPGELVERILEILEQQIGEIIGLALTPLRLFMSEERITDDEKEKNQKLEQSLFRKRLIGSLSLVLVGFSMLFIPPIRHWGWLQNHPNRLGLYGCMIVMLLGVSWGIIDKQRRQWAIWPVVVGALFVILQLVGR